MPAGKPGLEVTTDCMRALDPTAEPRTPYRSALGHAWYGRTLMLQVNGREHTGTVVGFTTDFSTCLMQLEPEAIVNGLLVLAVTVPTGMVQAEYEAQQRR